MHELTADKSRPIRFRAWFWNNTEYRFQFQSFQVENKSSSYTLRLGGYNSSASSAVPASCKSRFLYNTDQKFSTIDRDYNNHTRHCARQFTGGGWWYRYCTHLSPNAKYCPSESCGSNTENIKVRCLMGNSYSMKRFQMDLLID